MFEPSASALVGKGAGFDTVVVSDLRPAEAVLAITPRQARQILSGGVEEDRLHAVLQG